MIHDICTPNTANITNVGGDQVVHGVRSSNTENVTGNPSHVHVTGDGNYTNVGGNQTIY